VKKRKLLVEEMSIFVDLDREVPTGNVTESQMAELLALCKNKTISKLNVISAATKSRPSRR
jgi:hypothetical protein